MNILPYRLSEIYGDKDRQALFVDVADHFKNHELTALLLAIHDAMMEAREVEDMAAALEEQREDAVYWKGQASYWENRASFYDERAAYWEGQAKA